MKPSPFRYDLEQPVELRLSGEKGTVIARAEYTNASPSYLVRYKSADGRQVENWQSEDGIADQAH